MWDAKLLVMRADKTHTLPANKEPGRHRRGEVINVFDWTGKPQTGTDNRTFVHIYVTDIPDSFTLQQAQAWLIQEHSSTTDGTIEVVNVVGDFQVGETITSGSTTATVDTWNNYGNNEGQLIVSNRSGPAPARGDAITGGTSGATAEYESFEGAYLARKKRVIPYSPLPNPIKNSLQNTGMATATWTQVKNFVKKRQANQTWDNIADNAVDDDDEVLP